MKSLIKIILSITFLFCSNGLMALELYVSNYGSDEWSGTLNQADASGTDGPFKTLQRAQQEIRKLKAKRALKGQTTVNIAGGTYYLDQTLTFDLRDSGGAESSIDWRGEPDKKVVISAGIPISCLSRNNIFWDCPITNLPASTTHFDPKRIKGNSPKFELYVDGRQMQLARWPDSGWAHIKLPINQTTQFSVMEILPTLTGDIQDAQVHIFAGNDWYDQYIGVDSIDEKSNTVKLSDSTSFSLESGRRFYIQNLPSLLNAPDEWIYDESNKKVTFITPVGVSPNEVTLSSLTNILIIDGASNLIFKNITFQHSTGTAIKVNKSKNIVLDMLDVNNIGGRGVELLVGENLLLKNSTIHHTGADGAFSFGGDRNTLKASGHVIDNNHIHHTGTTILTYTPSIRLFGVGTKVTHNLLEQGAGSSIVLEGNEHLIEKNELHHFCLQAADCGAVYAGRDWSARGNVIQYNYIHDIIGYGMEGLDISNNQVSYRSYYQSRGVYLDDGASGFIVTGNIFENAGYMALMIGGGRDNKIVNNFFLTNEYAIWQEDRKVNYDWSQNQKKLDSSPYKTTLWRQKYPELAALMHNKTLPEGNRIERNVIVSTKSDGRSLHYFVPKNTTVIADNLIWSATGKLAVDYKIFELNKHVKGAPWSQWINEGIEKGSLIIDPCVTIVNKKMITCPGSPVKDIGFIPLPTDIGLMR